MTNNKPSRDPKQKIDVFDFTVTCERKGKQYHYTLEKDEKKIYQDMHKDAPGIIGSGSKIVRGIIKKMSGEVKIQSGDIEADIADDKLIDFLMNCLQWLDDLLIAYEENKEEFEAELQEEEEHKKLEELSLKAEKFMEFLEEQHITINDFLWYSSEWISGGESQNTITGFLCHISTYFKIKPIWFMALGKAGEGKSVIEEASIELMPHDAVMNGRVSEKTLYRKSSELGNCYLDGRILAMGDMGGKKDIEKWADTIDRYKELTTDGKAEFEVVGEGIDENTGERKLLAFILEGHPSVLLTSVNSESFDDQIMSRGINVSPVATNEDVRRFFYYNKGKIAEKRKNIMENEIGLLRNYIEYIRSFYEGIQIINPYWTCLENWFRKSEYYKRALGLYPSLVEAVTLLNYHYRETIEIDGELFLVATREDNKLIADLFNPSQGISEPAVRVFNLILKWYDDFDPEELKEYQEDNDVRIRDCKSIFSAGEIRHRSTRIRSLKGLPYGDIMSTLVNHGLIEAVDKEKRSNKNIYILSHNEPLEQSKIDFDMDKIIEYVNDLEWIHGTPATHILKLVNQEKLVKASDMSDCDLKLPPWKSQGRIKAAVYKGSRPPKATSPISSATQGHQTTSQRPPKAAPINHEDKELVKEWEDFK